MIAANKADADSKNAATNDRITEEVGRLDDKNTEQDKAIANNSDRIDAIQSDNTAANEAQDKVIAANKAEADAKIAATNDRITTENAAQDKVIAENKADSDAKIAATNDRITTENAAQDNVIAANKADSDAKIEATNDRITTENAAQDNIITANKADADRKHTATNDRITSEVGRLDTSIGDIGQTIANNSSAQNAKNDEQDKAIAGKADRADLDATNQVVANNNAAQNAKNDEQDKAIAGKADRADLDATNSNVTANSDAIKKNQDDIKATNDRVTTEVGRLDKDKADKSYVDSENAAQDEAINVERERIDKINQSFADSLGGNVTIYADGSVVMPEYSVGGQKYDNVGSALDATNDRITNLESRTAEQFGYVRKEIDEQGKQLSAGIASVSAIENAPYVSGAVTYGVGASHYNDESAIGISLRKTDASGRWSIGGGVSTNTQNDPLFRIGISGILK